jgi:malonate-semialdehyde dehydrogenase (acetylating)/methylmalonate-semialdehyde dehydrogenase
VKRISHWIGGRRVEEAAGGRGQVFDPAVGAAVATVDFADASLVDHAVRTAAEAFRSWSLVSLSRKAAILFAYRELILRHLDELAALVAAEHGKLLADAKGEVQRGLEVVEFACGMPHLLKGEHSVQVSTGVDSHSLRQPLGVVAGITPFNFPAMVPMWMFPLAIACGNTFVLKPSEKDPSTSVRLAELFSDAGLPDGVFNVVHGDVAAVHALLAHPEVAAVSFVGSTPVAKAVHEAASRAGKRVQALGGAKNHMVVMPDADLEVAADAAVSAAYGSAGERCMAISALVAVGGVADELVSAIAKRAESLRVGPATDPDADMGPLVTAEHRQRVASYLDVAADEGAEVVIDGRGVQVADHPDGFWLGPSLVDWVTPSMSVYRDEIFGPVLSVVRVENLSDALELLARNPYGNGAAIFTASGAAARRFELEATAGMIGVNVAIPVPMAFYSFGGWKDSLFGDVHVHGPEGVRFYTRSKAVTTRWPSGPAPAPSLSFPSTD